MARFVKLGLPLYCGGRRGNEVALTFDDGPGVYTRRAIVELRRGRARATFFLVGRNLPTWPRLPRLESKIAALGDHTYTHPYLPGLQETAMQQELSRTQSEITARTGARPELFRPPYGALTPAVEREAQALRMLTVLWNVDSRDALGADKRGIATNVDRGLRPGSIVLMHENRGQTIVALRRAILPALRRRHLRAVTVPELLRNDPPSLRQLRAGLRGCPGSAVAAGASG